MKTLMHRALGRVRLIGLVLLDHWYLHKSHGLAETWKSPQRLRAEARLYQWTGDRALAARLAAAATMTELDLPVEPTPTQSLFMNDPATALLWKDKSGAGKTVGILLTAVQCSDRPNYHSIIFRRNPLDLTLPGGLADTLKQWLDPRDDCTYNANEGTWVFANGATIQLASLSADLTRLDRYAATEYQLIGFDKIEQMDPDAVRWMFSRLRRAPGTDLPLMVRASCHDDDEPTWARDVFPSIISTPGRRNDQAPAPSGDG